MLYKKRNIKSFSSYLRKYLQSILPIALFFCMSYSEAQMTTEKRIDFQLNMNDNDEFNVITFEEKGVIVLNSKSNNYGRDIEINFIKFDSTLSQIWTNSYQADFLFRLVKYYETEDHLYCLFKEDDKQNINILRLDITSGDFVVTESKLLTPMNIDLFTVIKSKVIIGGRYNDRPVVELVNLFSQSAIVLPEIHSNNVKLNNIQVNEEEGLIYILLKNERNCKLFLKVYDYEGKLIGDEILGEKNKLPLNGRLIKIPNGGFVLAGNYADNCSDYSVGFYTHSLSEERPIRYFDFVDLENFLSYMPEKKQNKMKNRIDKKNQKGKDFKLRQRLLIQDPTESEDGLTILAEVFYPEYKNYTNFVNPVGRNYRWSSNNYHAFNNFRYTHALILHFNHEGDLLWDNSISLNDLQSRTLDHKVQYSYLEGSYVLAYPDDGIIKTTIFDGASQTFEDIPLEMQSHNEKVVETYQSELSAWFGHSFIAYGIQSVRQRTGEYPKDFFYLSKLTYE